jgi:WD40 repeat protein
MGGEITFIKPNPEAYPDILAVCTKNNELRLVRYLQKQVISTIYNITSLCWSPKGKQIICGTKDGTLYAYDIEGNPKDEIQAPPAVQSDHYGKSVFIKKKK